MSTPRSTTVTFAGNLVEDPELLYTHEDSSRSSAAGSS